MKSLLISASELQTQNNIVILDCRFNLMDKNQGQLLYKQGHIPGAYYMDLEKDLSSPVQQHGGRHPLPDIHQLEKKLRLAGVNQHSTVVLYDDSRMAYAARAWWLLNYMGHDNIKILNGGFNAWRNMNGAIDKREPQAKAGNFKARLKPELVVHRETLINEKKLYLIDSREERRYLGLEEPIDPIAGHITGAINYPWQAITDEKGFMKPLVWQEQYWSHAKEENNIVVYCGSGVTACVNIFSLSLLGIKTKLYAGSWSDWCSYMNQSETALTPN